VSAVTQRQQLPEISLPAAKSPRQFDDRYAFRHTSKMGQKATLRDHRYCVVADTSPEAEPKLSWKVKRTFLPTSSWHLPMVQSGSFVNWFGVVERPPAWSSPV